jgi:gliding motility-associated-like protein
MFVRLSAVLFLIIVLRIPVEAQVNLNSGLVGYYPFSGNTDDASGNKNNGMNMNGVQLTSDRFGTANSAYYFDGIDDYIEIPDNGTFASSSFTVAFWFRSEKRGSQVMLGKREYTPSNSHTYGITLENVGQQLEVGSFVVGNNKPCDEPYNSATSDKMFADKIICSNRWYFVVASFTNGSHKIYLDGVLLNEHSTAFQGLSNCTDPVRLGVWWQGDPNWFQGKMDDLRIYNRAINQQEVTALYDNYSPKSNGSSLDFSYTQNVCSPKTIQFSLSDPLATNYFWNFGDGQTAVENPSPTVTYDSYGTYSVTLTTKNVEGCLNSSRKIVPVTIANGNVILSADTTICSGSSIKLSTDSGIAFCWKPDPSINNPAIANTTVTPTKNTTYFFTTQVAPGNLVTNGDFSAGDFGFTSDYTPGSPNTKEAEYYVANDSYAWNRNFNSCKEHTTGNGKMMMVNGSSVNGSKVWTETVAVSQNTNYAFSVWVESLAALNPANLRFSINGVVLGDNINAGSIACEWSRFYTTWNSGNAITATITIVNNNTIADGNDFAIDDVSFSQVFLRQDSIKVNVTTPPSVRASADTAICGGTSIKLSAAGVKNYQWSPAEGLSDPSIQNPLATPAATTSFVVEGYNEAGCVGRDTVIVNVLSKPTVAITNDTTLCAGNTVRLTASGGTTYLWTPSASLSANNIANPIAKPATTTTYIVVVKDADGCSNSDSVTVAIAKPPSVTSISDTTVCSGIPVNLTTTSSTGVTYDWFPATGLSDPTVASPVATPSKTTDYIITVMAAKDCQAKDTVHVSVLPTPTVATSGDTTICTGGSAQLSATGGVSYHWFPSTGLSNPSVYNPIATASHTTVYAVNVTGSNGCSSRDSLTLMVRLAPVFDLQPKTSTICLNNNLTLTASGGDVYEWLPKSGIASPTSNITGVKPTSTTTYQVRIYDSICRTTDTLSANVVVNPLPPVTVTKSNDIDCFVASTTLTATGGNHYVWTPAVGLSNPNVSNPVASPTASTVYVVNVTGANGCSNTDSIPVMVAFNNNVNSFYLPTAFTPNADGKNDCFGIKSWGPVSNVDFSIFNRWGERVFYSKNGSDCWDGNYKNIKQDTGSFIYVIKAKSVCGGEINRKGTVLLIR